MSSHVLGESVTAETVAIPRVSPVEDTLPLTPVVPAMGLEDTVRWHQHGLALCPDAELRGRVDAVLADLVARFGDQPPRDSSGFWFGTGTAA